jgi:hypothetical protein
VAEKFKSSVEWEFLISEDPYSEALINYIVNKYSFALIGNKNKIKGGAVSGKLLRLLKCNILSIPKSAKPIISKIGQVQIFQMPRIRF